MGSPLGTAVGDADIALSSGQGFVELRVDLGLRSQTSAVYHHGRRGNGVFGHDAETMRIDGSSNPHSPVLTTDFGVSGPRVEVTR